MTPAELQLYKKELEFYKYNPEVDTFMNSGSGTTKGTETVISDVSDKDLDDILSNNDDF
jgi:hypothetical protein